MEWDREEGKEPNLDFSNTKSTPRLQIKGCESSFGSYSSIPFNRIVGDAGDIYPRACHKWFDGMVSFDMNMIFVELYLW